MDKARLCVQGAKCAAKRKPCKEGQKLLLYEKPIKRPQNDRKKVLNLGCNTTCAAKKIRVCTGAELKKMCPKTPPCKPPPPPDDNLAFLAKILWFAIKAGIFGGLVLFTYQAGVWGDNDDTQRLYKRLCSKFKGEDDEEEEDKEYLLLGYCNQNQIFMDPQESASDGCPLPTEDANLYYIQRKWNEIVVEIGHVIVAGPYAFVCMVSNWFTQNSDDLNVEESKRKALEVTKNIKEVESYNNSVLDFEEKKIKEREERIKELKKRYERRLRLMKKLEMERAGKEAEENNDEDEEGDGEKKGNTC